jgi:ADP-ribose pyrophosphatase YjhB (NUDIX family)
MVDGVDPVWRPKAQIRAVAIGIVERDEAILVVHVPDDTGALKGCRPPGGGVEFMETAAVALAREFREELGCAIAVTAGPLVIENLYEHHGAPGHEIVFVHRVRLLDPTLYARDAILVAEDNGKVHRAEWVALDRFRSGEIALFPAGLLERLAELDQE